MVVSGPCGDGIRGTNWLVVCHVTLCVSRVKRVLSIRCHQDCFRGCVSFVSLYYLLHSRGPLRCQRVIVLCYYVCVNVMMSELFLYSGRVRCQDCWLLCQVWVCLCQICVWVVSPLNWIRGFPNTHKRYFNLFCVIICIKIIYLCNIFYVFSNMCVNQVTIVFELWYISMWIYIESLGLNEWA